MALVCSASWQIGAWSLIIPLPFATFLQQLTAKLGGMPKITDLPKFKRPRERLALDGPQALKDYELLLAILLRTGYAGKSALDVARRILKRYSLKELANLEFKELAKLKGVGVSRATTIMAAFALAKRANPQEQALCIRSAEDAVKVLSFIKDKKREYFVALYLDAEHKLITTETISIGSLDASLVHPREVFYPAIKHKAVSVIVAHNHPSGNLTPSPNDIQLTKTLAQVGNILNINLLDHLIVVSEGHTSLKRFL